MFVSYGTGLTVPTGPIIDGYVLRQSFVAAEFHLKSVSVLLSTYRRKNDGIITATITDSKNRVLARDQFAAASLTDNAKHVFRLPTALIPGGTYEFRIQTLHCRSGQAATAHCSNVKHGGYLFVGGQLVRHKELVCDFEYVPTLSANESDDFSRRDDAIFQFLNQKNPLLSVIILNKDGRDLIQRCVDGIISNTDYQDIEIVIGDTGTQDPEVLEYYGSLPSNVTVVPGLKYHFSKTNNLLAQKHAKGEYLLFLNNDVFLEEDAISAMMNYVRIHRVGAVGLRLMKPRGVIDHDGQILFKDGVITTPDHLNINFPPNMVVSEDAVTEGVTAACMLTRRAVFTAMGGFDNEYHDVYQDCDYCLKLAAQGFCCVTVRSVSSQHVGSATRGVTQMNDPMVTADRERFFQKWGGFRLRGKPRYSFITCCNKPEIYAGFMHSLPDRRELSVELVPVNNFDNRFTITQALNLGAVVATGNCLVYCHQDILLCESWIRRVTAAISRIPALESVGIIGFEGIQDGGTPWSCRSVNPHSPQQVQTLDELCLMTFRRDLVFDESFSFHYYGADICMQAEKMGLKNFLLGVPVTHLSGGAENVRADPEGFKKQAEHFSDKWRHRQVWTTTTKFLNGGIHYMIVPELNG